MYPTSLAALQSYHVVVYDIYKRVETRLIVVMGDAVVFTNNEFFICFCRYKETFF